MGDEEEKIRTYCYKQLLDRIKDGKHPYYAMSAIASPRTDLCVETQAYRDLSYELKNLIKPPQQQLEEVVAPVDIIVETSTSPTPPQELPPPVPPTPIKVQLPTTNLQWSMHNNPTARKKTSVVSTITV